MIEITISDVCSDRLSVSNALKRCKVILSHVESEDLALFVKKELEGYNSDDCPDYRILLGEPKGTYRDRFYGRTMMLPLDFTSINKLSGINFNERNIITSIAEIEHLLDQSKSGNGEICYNFTPDQMSLLYDYSNATNDNGWILEKAWWTFPINLFKNIYSRTQDRLIEILIKINKDYPQLNEKLKYMAESDSSGKSFQTNIHGNIVGSNVAFGEKVSQNENVVNYNKEINDVLDKIISLGFDREDVSDLEPILLENKKTGEPVSKQLLAWLGKTSKKAVEKGIEHVIPQLTETLSNFF